MTRQLFPLLGFIVLVSMAGCPDWWAYNVESSPPELTLIPSEKLWLQWHELERREANQHTSSYVAALEDNEWASAFDAVARDLYGWQPDFCIMYSMRNFEPSYVTRDLEDPGGVKGHTPDELKKAFWRSYLRNIYFDAIAESPSVKQEEPLAKEIKLFLQWESKYLLTTLQPPLQPQGFFGKQYFEPASKELEDTRTLIVSSVNTILMTPPKCLTLPPSPAPSAVSRSFLKRLLFMIDVDHDQLLVDFDETRNPKAKEFKRRIAKWCEQEKSCCRALTLSKLYPASLSQSVKAADMEPKPDKEPFFPKDALVELAKVVLAQSCPPDTKEEECMTKRVIGLTSLLKSLDRDYVGDTVTQFTEIQKLELTLSSAVNSPDSSNRLEYVTNYLYFYPYPYPSNGMTILENEFWQRFRAYQMGRPADERKRTLEADLDAVWLDMSARIENVETMVQHTPLEIAQVTRESGQSVQVKPQPSIELKGTIKGTLETPIDLTSTLKTTVIEKLLKELDRRSTWLNADRNLLRITQRGMEAANIQGSFKEKVSIRIPQSIVPINYLEVKKGVVKVAATSQPIYSSIPAVSISLGVVREPTKLRRSASEKYGLLDSSDARYIVVVAEPVWLRLWHWERYLNAVTTDDLAVEDAPPHVIRRKARLRFYHPQSGSQGRFATPIEGGEEFIEELRMRLHGLVHPVPPPPKKGFFSVQCKWGNPQKTRFYLLMNLEPTPTEKIWIGKEEDNVMVPFDGKESNFLHQVMLRGGCL